MTDGRGGEADEGSEAIAPWVRRLPLRHRATIELRLQFAWFGHYFRAAHDWWMSPP